MAGDWMKLELVTPDKQEVWSMAENLELDPDAVVGKLIRVWRWFDQHSEEGNARSVSKALLDREVCVSGFCEAMKNEGWMLENEGVISLPNFDKHNGKSAKNRANTAKRVAKHKGLSGANGGSVTKVTVAALPREEKRREEVNKGKTTKSKKFTPPTVEQVAEYCKERGNSVNANRFVNFYDANGWVQSRGKPIKDWMACVRTWEGNDTDKPRNSDLECVE